MPVVHRWCDIVQIFERLEQNGKEIIRPVALGLGTVFQRLEPSLKPVPLHIQEFRGRVTPLTVDINERFR